MERLKPHLPMLLVKKAVEEALVEDLGRAGDITSNATIPSNAEASCVLASREEGVLAGIDFARAAFSAIDPEIEFKTHKLDCELLSAGDVVSTIKGNARAILSAERVALNFLMRMSGIATYTATFVKQVAGTGAEICCTRKTVPGHRAFDKYAVKCGGGSNHRFGLDDAVLIKDNHIAVAGGVALAVRRARHYAGHLVKIEVEVDTHEQFLEALEAGPDVILLDNMTPKQLAKAVRANRKHDGGRIKLEASGNVNIQTVGEIAKSGVDFISTSKITMAAPTLDLGLDISLR